MRAQYPHCAQCARGSREQTANTSQLRKRDRDMDPILGGLSVVPIGATGLLSLVVVLMLTDRLIWHKRLTKAEADRDRWQQVALNALGVADKLTVQGEVTTKLVAALPDPGR